MKVRQVQHDTFSEFLVNKPCVVLIAKYTTSNVLLITHIAALCPHREPKQSYFTKFSGSGRCLLFYLFYMNASTRTCEGEIESITAEKDSRVILTSTLSEISRF